MAEVTINNFTEIYPKVEKLLRKAKFVALDVEFSALNPHGTVNNSLFDTAEARYRKLHKTFEQVIPLQIGITPFLFDADNNAYSAEIFTFYVFPKPFFNIDSTFICQSSSFQFLCTYQFDFNKFFYDGIPYINTNQEEELRKVLTDDNFVQCDQFEFQRLLSEVIETINKWVHKSKVGETLVLDDVYEKHKHNIELIYSLHKRLRNLFEGKLWTYTDNNNFIVQHVNQEEFVKLVKEHSLEQQTLDSLLGFTKVFRLLKSLEKPIIGHNILNDLMILTNVFEAPLPKSFTNFKNHLHKLFPNIYDTKTISFELRTVIPQTKRWKENTLEHLYVFFKDGHGRHLQLNSPYIHFNETLEKGDQFHNAGWDSYCTGYIFIRMAHIFASQQYENASNKTLMSSQLFGAMKRFENSLNLIRSSVPFIQLDGKDPESTRPPWLVVESVQNRSIDLTKISSILSSYGCVEVKPLSRKGQKALIAVDNFGSARRIMSQFNSHSEYRIKPYSAIQHSPILRAAVWSSTAASGLLFIWLLHSVFTK